MACMMIREWKLMEEVINMRPVVSVKQTAVQEHLHISSTLTQKIKDVQQLYKESTEWS